jgi:arylsulfatase
MKLMASDLGGTRNPMAVRWPAKIAADPTPRAQFPPLQRRRPNHL